MTTPYALLVSLAQDRLNTLHTEAAAARLVRQSFAQPEVPHLVRAPAPQPARPLPLG
ncbi:GAF modulated sigma54 specific transcriptional regulator, fis family [Deinococcus maricopensis DSM 21211]|uniref:GAF modulated sigma54 specific transcriptional regulator, fis family n=1 Tax=Deinococcus maricopensis (strain DSM 21211 / LMG 22137 / NRRL B-23946 / LB-34) TaxID=709986 RepID=E8U8T2_DEIML|nr:GAF modulated sigma54 specific transcriptional regulator, fis family [Deinococcus maricopensis DSM 21211]